MFTTSWLLWKGLALTVKARVSFEAEQLGQDTAELGIEAYPEFVLMPEEFPEMPAPPPPPPEPEEAPAEA